MNPQIISKYFNDEPITTQRMCGLTNYVYKA